MTKSALYIALTLAVFAGIGFGGFQLLKDTPETTSDNTPCGDNVCDASEQENAALCPADCEATTNESTLTNVESAKIIFAPDAGVRMDYASNPGTKVNTDGTIFLLYEDNANGGQKVSISEDGLTFEAGESISGAEGAQFRALKLPDGTCRAYGWNSTKGITDGENGLSSMSSEDCVNYTTDEGYRYTLQENDNGTMGVYEFFNDSKGGVVMLYIGDMYGLNNVRRAYSTDNGWTFAFDKGNVFGDEDAGGGNASYVDEKAIVLEDGTVHIVAMKTGDIYTFVSVDDGETFELEGIALSPNDFSELNVGSLHDPQIVQLPDGRLRIYVTALLKNEDGSNPQPTEELHQIIVSATTEETY